MTGIECAFIQWSMSLKNLQVRFLKDERADKGKLKGFAHLFQGFVALRTPSTSLWAGAYQARECMNFLNLWVY